ncbi:MAG: hypothetical protein GXO65_05180 [Euryarchaeota archaeon]|nr:hypothetical protein [Euryarchaeota archaeon]
MVYVVLMNPYLALPFLSLLLNGTLGCLVYRKNPRGRANRIFLLFTSSIALWSLAALVFEGTSFHPWLFTRLVFLGVIPLPAIFLHFTYAFPRPRPVDRRLKAVFYAPSAFFTLLLFTDYLVAGTRETPWGPDIVAGGAGPFLFLYFVLYTGAAYLNLYNSLKATSSRRVRQQVMYLVAGTGIFFVAGNAVYVGNLIMGMEVPPLAELSSIVMAGFMTYAIFREDLLDIDAGVERLAPLKKRPLRKGMFYFTGSQGYSLFADTVTSPCPECPVESFPCESQDCRTCHIDCPCNFCDRDRIKDPPGPGGGEEGVRPGGHPGLQAGP